MAGAGRGGIDAHWVVKLVTLRRSIEQRGRWKGGMKQDGNVSHIPPESQRDSGLNVYNISIISNTNKQDQLLIRVCIRMGESKDNSKGAADTI